MRYQKETNKTSASSTKAMLVKQIAALELHNSMLKIQNKELLVGEHVLTLKLGLLIESVELQNKIVSILSHDIRTPLIALRNLVQSFYNNSISNNDMLKYLPDMEENIKYLYELFDDMLIWSKEQKMQQDGKKSILNIKEISEEICRAYKGTVNAKKIKLQNDIGDAAIIHANERYLKIILRNLLSNAIKFTSIGGMITISSGKQGHFDMVSVKDTGCGISAENLSKIRNGFDLNTYSNLNEIGTGIGLYFCNEFAIRSGGALKIESEPGKGTVFNFLLPAA